MPSINFNVSPSGLPAEAALPAFPSPTYLVELGVTHLIGDRLLTGSRLAVQDATRGITSDLRGAYDTWHMGGHLGEIGKSALEMEPGKKPSVADEVRAVRRSAVMMATLGVADAVASEFRGNRTPDNSLAFFSRVEDSFRRGVVVDPGSDGPRWKGQLDTFLVAARAGRYLKLDGAQQDAVQELFSSWATVWAERLSLSAPDAERDPTQLLQIAQLMGMRAMDVARVVVLGAKREGHPALQALGAIGGLEEHGSYPFSAARRGLHTYQTELIQRHGAERGLAEAAEMRVQAETELYGSMRPSLETGRQRRVARTVTWFATKVGGLHRRGQKLDAPAVRERLETKVAQLGR
jgi:hypothetical protein